MKSRKVLVCAVLLAVVILLNLPLPAAMRVKASSRDNMAPFQNVMWMLISRSRTSLSFLWDARTVVGEKEELEEEIANLRFQLQNLNAVERDNARLREILGFKSRQKYELIMCEVMSRGGMGGWWQTLRLNKGVKDGVREDMAVITMDGLIGRTGGKRSAEEGPGMVVSKRTCDVLLITDPNCKVACKFSRSGAFGIVKGSGVAMDGSSELAMLCEMRPCHMDYIPKDKTIREGDEVVTSGLGGVYPEGLRVGYVRTINPDESGLYQRAEIVPFARLRTLKHAFVVVPRKEAAVRGRPERTQPPGPGDIQAGAPE